MCRSTLSLTSAIYGVGCQRHAPAALPREREPVAIVKEDGWDPGPVWTSAEKLALAGIRSSDRPTRSKSLFRLSHSGPPKTEVISTKLHCVTSRKS